MFEDTSESWSHGRVPQPHRIAFQQHHKKAVLVIAGPTATGKTAFSIEIAKKIGGEIISADSMQVYRGMDIGTAKVTNKEAEGIPHHLIDLRDITEVFNVVDYVEHAHAAITDIQSRGKVPIVVGGTGFYIHALMYGPPQGPPASAPIREKLEKDIDLLGPEALYQKIVELDPEYAQTIGSGDRQKIVRALEIMALTNKRVSEFGKFRQNLKMQKHKFKPYFIYYPKEILYQRIDARCDVMIEQGFPEEVERLEKQGLRKNLSASQAIGYKQYLEFLASEHSDEDWQEFVESFKRASRRYAKRQFTWFRGEKEFEWLNLDEMEREEVIHRMLH